MATFGGSTFSGYAKRVFLVVGLLELGLGAAFGVAAMRVGGAAAGGLWLTAGILGATGVILLLISFRAAARAARADRIERTGVQGQAAVLGIAQTGMYMNENPQVELDLQVYLPNAQPYRVKHRQFVPLILLGRLGAAGMLPVKVDPQDPASLVVLWDQLAMPFAAAFATPGGGPAFAAGQPLAGSGNPTDQETLSQIQQALAASGAAAAAPFGSAAQGQYTLDQLRSYLRTNGVSGWATIDEVQDTGQTVGDERLFTMRVTVEVPGVGTFQGPPSASMVPAAAASKVAVGRRVPVKVAADNPGMMMFEWDRI